jgi:hypothetical protein
MSAPSAGRQLELRVIPTPLAICKLPAAADIPPWAAEAPFLIAVRTPDELTLVCSDRRVPDPTKADRRWRGLTLKATLGLAETGVMAALVVPLADADVPVFTSSTFSTDYLLVPGDRLKDAVEALGAAGHTIED